MQTTGKETVCDGDQFILESINVEPPIGGGFGWFFLNDATGGTGALGSNFILNGVTTLDTFDADLGGTCIFKQSTTFWRYVGGKGSNF